MILFSGNLIPDLFKNERKVKRKKKEAKESFDIVSGGLKEIGGKGDRAEYFYGFGWYSLHYQNATALSLTLLPRGLCFVAF